MTLEKPDQIAEGIWKGAPLPIKKSLQNLNKDEQEWFTNEYAKRSYDTTTAYLAWLCCGLHHAYLGNVGMQICFWLVTVFSLGIVGFIWWFIDLLNISDMCAKKNQEIAIKIISEIKNLAQ